IDLGRFDESLRYSTRARQLSQRTGDQFGLAEALNNAGLEYYSTGAMQKALLTLDQSRSIFQAIGNRMGQAEALANMGYTRQDLGDSSQALDLFQKSLSLAEALGHQRIRALDLTVIGLVNSVLGDKQKALGFHNRALTILRRIGNRHGEAVVDDGIASVYSDIGESQLALHYCHLSLRIFTALGDRDLEGLIMGLIGDVYLNLKEPKQALTWYERRLRFCRMSGSGWVAAHTLNDIGAVYDVMHQPRRALEYYNGALAEERVRGDRRGQAYSLDSIGFTEEELGDREGALQRYHRAFGLFGDVVDGEGQIQALDNIARAERDLGHLQQAHQAARSLIERLETQRAKVAGPEFRTAYRAFVDDHYKLYIDVVMNMHFRNPSAGYQADGFEASERGRARSLLDMLREARTDIREGVPPALLERERILQATLNSEAADLTKSMDSNPDLKLHKTDPAVLRKDIATLIAEYDAVESEIRANSPRYASLTQPRMPGLAEIQRTVLDRDTLLLEYSLGKERSYLWAVTANSIDSYVLPPRDKIEKLVTSFYNSISEPPSEQNEMSQRSLAPEKLVATTKELSKMVLGPVAGKLTRERIVVVADGLLQYVPFAALSNPAQFSRASKDALPLAEDHEIVNVPSASVLLEMRNQPANRPAASKTVAIFADPVFDAYDSRVSRNSSPQTDKTRGGHAKRGRGGLRLGELLSRNGPAHYARLVFAGKEAADISQLVPKPACGLFLGFDANRSLALGDEAGKYRIVHFATHALFDNSHPELSGIVLSLVDKQGNPVDGFLRLNEIYNMKLAAGLVVLSACQTALGKPAPGEGLVGLTRGFMYAGASRVVASLWEVDDQATEELMKLFYERLLTRHLTAAEALREAQIAIRRDQHWRSPYYWAGFILQGDWR
ncbi:MAG TPA: CHAT domain-containing protein, partial [Blastocatellia bacterium]|nr:CHAT domain-containing protein [Blastocatellia bacterium]